VPPRSPGGHRLPLRLPAPAGRGLLGRRGGGSARRLWQPFARDVGDGRKPRSLSVRGGAILRWPRLHRRGDRAGVAGGRAARHLPLHRHPRGHGPARGRRRKLGSDIADRSDRTRSHRRLGLRVLPTARSVRRGLPRDLARGRRLGEPDACLRRQGFPDPVLTGAAHVRDRLHERHDDEDILLRALDGLARGLRAGRARADPHRHLGHDHQPVPHLRRPASRVGTARELRGFGGGGAGRRLGHLRRVRVARRPDPAGSLAGELGLRGRDRAGPLDCLESGEDREPCVHFGGDPCGPARGSG